MTHRNLSRHLLRSGSALALVALVSACSSSNTATRKAPDDSTPPPGQMQMQTQLQNIKDKIAAARTAVTAVGNTSSAAEVKAADDAVAAARKAIADARAVPDADKTKYTTELTALETRLTTAKTARRTAMDAASTAASKLVAAAITAHEPGTAHSAVDLPDALLAGSLKTEFKDDATTIALRRAGGQKLTAVDVEPTPTGWTGKKFSFDRNKGAVFTNLGPAKVTTRTHSWDVLYTPSTGQGISTAITAATDGELTFVADTTGQDAANAARRVAKDSLGYQRLGSDFVVTIGTLLPARPARSSAGTNSIQRSHNGQISGSYRGIAGTFACAAACIIKRYEDDTVSFSTALTFTPSNSALADLDVTTRLETPDSDYIEFGYWMTGTGSGGAAKQTIETFAAAKGYGDSDTSPQTLTKTATYSGAAAGIYVHKRGDLNNPVMTNGEFVADASLKATFGDAGDGRTAVADQFSVTGTVDNFRSTTGDRNLSGWELELQKADLGERDAATGAVSGPGLTGFTGTTSGGQGTTAGAWSGSFFGNSGSSTAAEGDDHPMAAVGEFNGHFTNGHVVGAFGVDKD